MSPGFISFILPRGRFHGGGKRRSVIAVFPTGNNLDLSAPVLPCQMTSARHVEAVHDVAG